jgi:hypothetical protein
LSVTWTWRCCHRRRNEDPEATERCSSSLNTSRQRKGTSYLHRLKLRQRRPCSAPRRACDLTAPSRMVRLESDGESCFWEARAWFEGGRSTEMGMEGGLARVQEVRWVLMAATLELEAAQDARLLQRWPAAAPPWTLNPEQSRALPASVLTLCYSRWAVRQLHTPAALLLSPLPPLVQLHLPPWPRAMLLPWTTARTGLPNRSASHTFTIPMWATTHMSRAIP